MGPGEAVKLQQVRCVIGAARHGSFRRAAVALNLQQSSVSRSVRDLEDHLGAPLFRRSAGGVTLTTVGAQFLTDAEAALEHLGRAAQMADAVGRDERHVLRVGTAAIPGSGFLPEALHALTAGRPGCSLMLDEASSAEHLLSVRFGSLDLAVVLRAADAMPGAEVLPLWREGLFCAAPAGRSPGASTLDWTEVGPGDLILPAGEIGDVIASRLKSVFGDAFRGATCRAGPETAMRLAAAGQGRAIVTAGAARLAPEGVCLLRVVDEGLMVCAVRLLRNEKPALRRLMALLREMAATPAGGGTAEAALVGNRSSAD